ncbi:hypothetical protein Ae201684P_009610 [Aphanomyces euteiches]|nr:hypothetical protein Ae201684P_009610 [Aphanomyces euteiches]
MIDINFSNVPTELVDWDPQIISLNTNGFSNSHRYILDKLSSVHDVSFIQETRFRTPSFHDRVAFHWQRITNHEGSLFFEEPIYPEVSTSPATGGLATLIHPHSPLKNATQVPHDNPVLRGRYLQVRCTLGPLTVVLHNIYAPAAFQERASYFEELPRDFPPHALHIVGGDFNCTLNKDLDSLRPSTSTMAGTLQLEQWMHSLSLVDLFRRQNPLARAFTSPTLTNRLDYIFCSSTLAGLRHWKATHMPHVPQADHVACRIITKRQTLRHGSGSWKAPTWLLRLPRAAEIVHGCLDRFLDKSPSFHNISKAYDMLVNDIRSQLKEFHSQRLEKQRLPLKQLTVEIASLLQVPNMRQDSVLVERVRDLQKQIHELQDRDKQFRQDQAFQLHLYKAERSSKFHFMSPVPTPLKKTVFKELVDVNGNIVSNQQGMSGVLVDYYKDLFAAPEVLRPGDEVSSFLTPLTRHKQLPEQAQQELSAPLRANEFYHAIRHSSSNSAPGPNALPFEVLKLAPHKWSLVLELLFTHQLHSHPRLTPMQLVSTLVLLHKKGPKSQAKNYRPISLLNTDVKILTSILAYRLQRHIRHIIHPDQQGFIRRSNIQTNIARLDDMLHHIKLHSPSSMVALLDFEKAFDRVDHAYLLRVLRHYGFPETFVDMVRVLYSGRKSRILVNGFLSKPVHISRGVLQGDPLSPLLFVIALEPMCQLLRQHSNYGIKCGDRYHTGSYFADDSQLYAANETCLHRQLALVRTFCDKSGFRLNVDKTQILTYSQLNGTLASLQVTSDSPVKALGILVAPNLSPLARFNYVFEKFVARLSLWLYKARTMAGKVTILHSICLPVLWYQLAFVPADKDLAKKIDKVMLQFMHGEEINPSSSVHGLRLIKKEIIFMPKKSGGFGLHHALALWQQHNRSVMIRCMQAITTPPRKSAMSAWITPGYTLLEHAFHPWGSPRDLLLANGTSAFIRQLYKNPNITPMWKALLSSWFDSRWTPYGCPNHISSLDVPLWHNSYLPGLEDLYDQCSTSTQDQANVLASLHITKLSHLLTPCQRVWPASILFDKINRACRQANFVPPTKQWISILVTKLSRLFDIVSEEDAPVFHLPTPNSEWMEWHWMIHPDSSPILLSLATSKSAKLRASPAVNSSILPTKHLNLPSNFYEDPKRLTQLAAYLQLDHILPRYGEFIFKTLLRANAMQYLFQYQDPKPTCVFCRVNETYEHFLFSCGYGQSVWYYFKAIQRLLECSFPSTCLEMFYETPKPADGYYIRGYLKIWPIVRACVYYQIWLQRADRTFRPDLTAKSPMEVAIHAASLIKLHLQQLLVDLPLKKGYAKVFNVLKRLSSDPWLRQHVIPDSTVS